MERRPVAPRGTAVALHDGRDTEPVPIRIIRGKNPPMRSTKRLMSAAAALLLLAACERSDRGVIVGPGDPGEPRDFAVQYQWVFEGFNGTTAVGYPSVQMSWLPPSDWNGEVFRIYGKRAGSANYTLMATVTSCTQAGCVYTDRDVQYGSQYTYYVASVDERGGGETSSEFAETIAVPASTRPAAPTAGAPVGLDDAVYLRWTDNANGASVARYMVFLTQLQGQQELYRVGETDGRGYLDEQAQNGFEYGYRVAAVDTLGHVSNLSSQMLAVPRPDFRGELVYAHAADPAQSGFRFVTSESQNPIVPGGATNAHFRLESGAAGWRLVPLNGAQVVEFGRTTALTCGPGADADCRAATVAPSSGYGTAPVAVTPEFSYVFRVPGTAGQTHHGVVRVTLLGSDQSGRDLMIFDWAYQVIPNEPRLNVAPR